MRETVYCPSCQQTVFKDDIHSCWDEQARAADKNVRDAERVVISRAVECVDDMDEYDQMPSGGDYRPYLARMNESQEALRAAVAALKAAEVAS